MFSGFAPTDRSRSVKPDLHPTYKKVMALCACGNSFETRSTAASIHVEVCAQCHPYFTGKQRLVDTAGRVDRFRRKYQTEPAAATPAAVSRGRRSRTTPVCRGECRPRRR